MSQKMFFAKCNYEIYDKKLLIIIKVFEKWRLECANTFVKNSIKIIFDHKNFEHFMIIKQLNRRQIKWIEFFAKFNFKIIYRFEIQNIKSNNLIRRTNDLLANDFDERKQFNNQIILKLKNLNVEIRNAIVLNDELHQLKNVIIKLTIITYDLITQIAADIIQQNSNLMNENFNDDENNVEKLSLSSIITN